MGAPSIAYLGIILTLQQPFIEVVLEGEDARVAVTQGSLTARYDDNELRQIGEGSSTLGLNRVIGDIAMNGNLERGTTKPLPPNLIDAYVAPGQAVAMIS